MNNFPVMVCDTDLEMLSDLVDDLKRSSFRDRQQLEALDQILQAAHVVTPEELPPDVIRLNSKFSIVNAANARRTRYQLVLPANADLASGRISILAPLGCALFGRAKGQVLEAQVPGGLRTLQIEQVWQGRRKAKNHRSSTHVRKLTWNVLQQAKMAA